MLIPVVLFIVGLILLIKGGDWFVEELQELPTASMCLSF